MYPIKNNVIEVIIIMILATSNEDCGLDSIYNNTDIRKNINDVKVNRLT